jgi:hypothetical protein
MEDKLVKCEHCGSELCYAHQINENAWAYSCTSCGFTANDLIKEGEYDIEKFEEGMPELYKEIKYIDNESRIWYPLVIQNEIGVIFIDGNTKDNWGWGCIKNRPLTEEEKQVYIEQEKEVPPYKSDSTTLKHFGKTGFFTALQYMGIA